jgi:prevent-host-death family protein
MDQIPASDAKARFSELLDKVEKGETVVITRHGRAIARLVPDQERRQKEIDEALASIRDVSKRAKKTTVAEIIKWKHEGHKY